MPQHISRESVDRIIARRKELNLSQKDLAERLGYSNYSIVSRIEKGDRGISPASVKKWATALETTPEYILLQTDDVTDFDFVDTSDAQIRRFSALKRSLSEEDVNLLLAIGETLKSHWRM